jgi:hypothetical protein
MNRARYLGAVTALLVTILVQPAHALTDAEKAEIRQKLAAITDHQFDQGFRCPESFGSQQEQLLAITDYVNWASARHPDWDQRQILEYRYALLVRHNCAETLRNIQR